MSARVCWCGAAPSFLQPQAFGDRPNEAVCERHVSRPGWVALTRELPEHRSGTVRRLVPRVGGRRSTD